MKKKELILDLSVGQIGKRILSSDLPFSKMTLPCAKSGQKLVNRVGYLESQPFGFRTVTFILIP